jgi:hypothetical protein
MPDKPSVGELPAFPVSPAHLVGSEPPATGMTYRQWLIGMAVANGKIGMQAVETAENVIKMLDKQF